MAKLEAQNSRVLRASSVLGLLSAAAVFASAGPAAAAATYSYNYDALGRLVGVTYSNSGHGYTTTYVYDAAGNRMSVTTTTF